MRNLKFETNHGEFFKEWKCGNVRILNDIHAKVFYHYEVQVFNGKTWDRVTKYRTLAEAKVAAAEILQNA